MTTWRTMKLHRRIHIRLEAIENSWSALPQVAAMPERLAITIEEFCKGNADGRGLKVAARQIVERTLKHIHSAVRKAAARGRRSRVLAHKARKFLKSLQHNDKFELTIEQARAFAGEMQKEGKREARRVPVCLPDRTQCGTLPRVGKIWLCRVLSVDELMRVGRRLGLCVARSDEVGRPYHNALRNLETEFWILTTAADPIALLTVEEEEVTRRVTEFQGRDGERPRAVDVNGVNRALRGPLLRKVLRNLDADASDQEHFTRMGAFRSLLPAEARKSYRDVIAEGRTYRVWRFKDEVILGSLRKGSNGVVQWSRFVRREVSSWAPRPTRPARKRYEWRQEASHPGAMDVDRFLELLAQSRLLYDAFADPRPNA